LTLVSRILGLLREMAKANLLGTSALSDAFSVAFMLPNLFRRLFAEGSVAVAFIPTFKDYLLAGDREKTREFLDSVFTFLTFFVTLAVMLGILAAPFLMPLFRLKAPEEALFLTRLMFPFLAFISLAAFFQGILNSLRVFTPSGLAPVLLNIAVILSAYGLGSLTGNPARAMAAGVLIGGFLEAAIQLPFVLKKGWPFFFTGLRRALANPGTRQVLRLVGPTILGMAAYQLNDLVSTALAGRAGEGVVSSLQYSLRLQELILGVFAVSIGTVLLPDLAEHAKSGRWELYRERLLQGMRIIALITIPITFFSLSRGELLVRLLFQGRSFGEDSVALTLSAFGFHMPGLFFIALNRILAPAFYAQSDSRSPTAAGIASFAVNMLLAALLAGPLRGGGVALALSVSSGVNTVLLLVFLGRKPRIGLGSVLKPALIYTAKMVFFSLIAALPLLWIGPRLDGLFPGRGRLLSRGLPLALSALIFGALGLALLLASGDGQLKALLGLFSRRGDRGLGTGD
jgi:putative peptidoglycan lipid II flippase